MPADHSHTQLQTHYAVLGPLEVKRAGQPIKLAAPRLRSLLASLLLQANKAVPVADLVDRVWNDAAPERPRHALQICILRLRKALGDADTIRTQPNAYAIQLNPDQLDALQFEGLVADAVAESDVRRRADLLTRALELWRGPVCSDVMSDLIHAHDAPPLEELRLDAEAQLIDLGLSFGHHAVYLARMRQLVAEHPYHERFRAQLMLALYRSGRSAEALEVYRSTAAVLAEELGIDPGAELQRLHQALLSEDPTVLGTTPSALPRQPTPSAAGRVNESEPGTRVPTESVEANANPFPVSRPVLAQLPAAPTTFVGRSDEMEFLFDLPTDVRPSSALVGAIDGMAGVGKTALALEVAHRLAPSYPDGQLYLDLHGHTGGIPPVDPMVALGRILHVLGVPGDDLPDLLDDRAALYRSVMADRRIVILLDNASREAQVLPLLPGGPNCLVLVTSRRRLTGLDATRRVSLDVLSLMDADELLRKWSNDDHSNSQDDAIEVANLCGRLPLALCIATARLRARPSWSFHYLARHLRESLSTRLDGFAAGQLGVAAMFDLSYDELTDDEQRALKLVALHPGKDMDERAAAALIGVDVRTAGNLLEELVEVHLVEEMTEGRYQLHDLIRAYARSRATSVTVRAEATTRLLTYYVHAASSAALIAHADAIEYQPNVGDPTVELPCLAEERDANRWLDSELCNLMAIADYAASEGLADHAVALATILAPHLRTRRTYFDAEHLFARVLKVSQFSNDALGKLWVRIELGEILLRRGSYTDAMDHFSIAAGLADAVGDLHAKLLSISNLGNVHLLMNQYPAAIPFYEQALEIARRTGDSSAVIRPMCGLGYLYAMQGRYDDAVDLLKQALTIVDAPLGNPRLRGNVLAGLGLAYLRSGRYGMAKESYAHALNIGHDRGLKEVEFNARVGLADIDLLQGQVEEAVLGYAQVLDTATDLGSENWKIEAHHGLGRGHLARERHGAAIHHLRQAARLAGTHNQDHDLAKALDGLAWAYLGQSKTMVARRFWQRALDLFTHLGEPEADEIQNTLKTLPL